MNQQRNKQTKNQNSGSLATQTQRRSPRNSSTSTAAHLPQRRGRCVRPTDSNLVKQHKINKQKTPSNSSEKEYKEKNTSKKNKNS